MSSRVQSTSKNMLVRKRHNGFFLFWGADLNPGRVLGALGEVGVQSVTAHPVIQSMLYYRST